MHVQCSAPHTSQSGLGTHSGTSHGAWRSFQSRPFCRPPIRLGNRCSRRLALGEFGWRVRLRAAHTTGRKSQTVHARPSLLEGKGARAASPGQSGCLAMPPPAPPPSLPSPSFDACPGRAHSNQGLLVGKGPTKLISILLWVWSWRVHLNFGRRFANRPSSGYRFDVAACIWRESNSSQREFCVNRKPSTKI